MIHCHFHKIIRRVVNSRGHTLTLPAANPDVNNGDEAIHNGNGNGKNWVCFLMLFESQTGVSHYFCGINLIITIGFVL
jgi:hypothetical protein